MRDECHLQAAATAAPQGAASVAHSLWLGAHLNCVMQRQHLPLQFLDCPVQARPPAQARLVVSGGSSRGRRRRRRWRRLRQGSGAAAIGSRPGRCGQAPRLEVWACCHGCARAGSALQQGSLLGWPTLPAVVIGEGSPNSVSDGDEEAKRCLASFPCYAVLCSDHKTDNSSLLRTAAITETTARAAAVTGPAPALAQLLCSAQVQF